MRPVLKLVLGLAALSASLSASSCKAHVHGVKAGTEVLTIDLTRGLS